MRIFPIISAVLVVSVLYLLVFEREKLLNFAAGNGVETSVAVVEETPAEPAPTVAAQEKTTPIVSVVAQTFHAQEIANAVLVRGRTEAARQVDVRAETSGQVISEPLRKGASVKTGQLLCQLDPGTRAISLVSAQARLAEAQARVPEAQARLPEAMARQAEAEARLSEAEINLNAAKRLSEGGFASETRVASAQAAHESALATVQAAKSGVAGSNSGVQTASAGVQAAQANVAAAEREIDRLKITAPFSGLLESDAAETGSLLQPGALCATVIQLDPIKLVGFVPETDVARVKVGVRAGARLATGAQVAGKVTFLSRSADPTTRTFRVEVQVPNSDFVIGDGQTAEIIIETAGEAAHLLPLSALTLNNDGDLGVRTVDDSDTVRFRPVTIIRDTTEGVWVAGLGDTVDVIVVGQEYVVDGVPVKVSFKDQNQ